MSLKIEQYFLKAKLLAAYNVNHQIDIICVSESYFNTKTLSSDGNLIIPGYNMSLADNVSGN